MNRAPTLAAAVLVLSLASGCTVAGGPGLGAMSSQPPRPTVWVTDSAPAVTVTAPAPSQPDPAPSQPDPAPSTTWVTTTAAPVTVTASAPAPAPTSSSPSTATSSALDALNALPVHPSSPGAGYTRDAFGQKYADTDRDGCDTRNQALRRDLEAVVVKPGTGGCVVLSGVLPDPYGGQRIPYARSASSPVDFEHVVSLADAWSTGASTLSTTEREQLANDPLNVLMVDASLNRSKGERDAGDWLPPAVGYRCAYVARQVAVKRKYRLWLTDRERAVMRGVLTGCPQQQLPSHSQVAFPPPR